jgi:hypothetical protein
MSRKALASRYIQYDQMIDRSDVLISFFGAASILKWKLKIVPVNYVICDSADVKQRYNQIALYNLSIPLCRMEHWGMNLNIHSRKQLCKFKAIDVYSSCVCGFQVQMKTEMLRP